MCMGYYVHMSGNPPHQDSCECLGSAEFAEVSYCPHKDADNMALRNNSLHSGWGRFKDGNFHLWTCRFYHIFTLDLQGKATDPCGCPPQNRDCRALTAVILGPNIELSLVLWMFTTERRMKQKLKTDWLEYKEVGRRENKGPSLGRKVGKEENVHRKGKATEDKISSLVENGESHSRSPFLNIHLC